MFYTQTLLLPRIMVLIISIILVVVLRKQTKGAMRFLFYGSIESSIVHLIFVAEYFILRPENMLYHPRPEFSAVFDFSIYAWSLLWTVFLFLFSMELKKKRRLL